MNFIFGDGDGNDTQQGRIVLHCADGFFLTRSPGVALGKVVTYPQQILQKWD